MPAETSSAGEPELQFYIATQNNTSIQTYDKLLDISAKAFKKDETFEWRYPGRAIYPKYDKLLFKSWIDRALLEPNKWVIIAVYKNTDGTTSPPVGVAVWHRHGPGSEEICKGRDSLLQQCESFLLSYEQIISNFLFKNPAANRIRIKLMEDKFKDIEKEMNARPNFTSRWHLNLLATDPEYQRRGIGGKLVQWGIERAQMEGINCALEASTAGKSVYEKYGFKEDGKCNPFHPSKDEEWADGMHCRNPDCSYSVGSIMIWEHPDLVNSDT